MRARSAGAVACAIALTLGAACSSGGKAITGSTPNASGSASTPGAVASGSGTPSSPGARAVTFARPHVWASGARTPASGTYAYDSSIDLGAKGGYSGERKQSFFGGEPDATGVMMSMKQTTQIFPSKERKVFWFRYRFTRDGVFELAEINPSSGLCTFTTPWLQMKLPLKVGATWHSSARCKEDGSTRTLDAKVDRTETRSVGSTKVATFVIKRQTRVNSAQPLLETFWFSPVYLINVHMDTTENINGATFDLTDDIRSLTPGALPSGSHPSGF